MFFNKNNKIIEVLEILETYLKDDINYLPQIDYKNAYINKDIKNKLESIFSLINKKQDEELLIYGELLLVTEKIAIGDFDDKIYHTNTSNHKLNYISKTINELVTNLKKNFTLVSITC